MSDAGAPVAVTPSMLVQQGRDVEALGELVRAARQAVDAVTLDRDAFGVLCSGVAPLLDGLHGYLLRCMDEGTESLSVAAGQLKRAAADYETTHASAVEYADRLAGTDPATA